MKKVIALTLCLLVLAGCSSETYKTGLGMVNSIGSSKEATAEAPGRIQADVTAAALTVDSKNTIVSISIDTVQTKVDYDATGKITTDLATEFKTKTELGPDYAMLKASPIGKEWFEQMDALETFAMGKTVEAFTGMKTKVKDEEHPMVPDEEALAATCTMNVSEYLAAVTKAAANLK